uniref:Uncharacterized protein n=1 Tax=Heterorhabditis bacteriophora TaxID=37862 RepID=A0A1I7X1G9_HETBA
MYYLCDVDIVEIEQESLATESNCYEKYQLSTAVVLCSPEQAYAQLAPLTRHMKMLNIASSVGSSSHFPMNKTKQKNSNGSLKITDIKQQIKIQKEESLQKRLIYVKKEWTVVNSQTSIYDKENSYQFEVRHKDFKNK